MEAADPPLVRHGTTVAWDGRGLLIIGASGAGKSALALDLMALGCVLVADDRTALSAEDGAVIARCPPAISGLIEARGVGLLRAETAAQARLVAVLDLDHCETDRLPGPRDITLLGIPVPLLHNPAWGIKASALLQYLKCGRKDVP